MKIEDFYKLHIGQKIYYNGEEREIDFLRVIDGQEKLLQVGLVGDGECLDFDFDKENFSFEKRKVKRAQYLYKLKGLLHPFCSGWYYKDEKDFLSHFGFRKEDYDFIIRLQETEREFDE